MDLVCVHLDLIAASLVDVCELLMPLFHIPRIQFGPFSSLSEK